MADINVEQLAEVLAQLGAGKAVDEAVKAVTQKVEQLPVVERLTQELADHRINPASLLHGFRELFARVEALEHPEDTVPATPEGGSEDQAVKPAGKGSAK